MDAEEKILEAEEEGLSNPCPLKSGNR